MDPNILVAVAALVLTMLISCATAVWTVANFRISAAVLTAGVKALCKITEDHEKRMRALERETQDCPALHAYYTEAKG